jgi:hypothetical protein
MAHVARGLCSSSGGMNLKEKHVPTEHHAPGLEGIARCDQEIGGLANGFGGDMGPAEGPVW